MQLALTGLILLLLGTWSLKYALRIRSGEVLNLPNWVKLREKYQKATGSPKMFHFFRWLAFTTFLVCALMAFFIGGYFFLAAFS